MSTVGAEVKRKLAVEINRLTDEHGCPRAAGSGTREPPVQP